MATVQIGRRGFAQVEPNHLAGIVEGKILAQLPVNKETMGSIIENGRFAKYDYAKHEVNLTGSGEWMLIYNEEKLYDERYQSHKDFAMIAENYTDEEIVPRLISTEVGDIMTTNAFGMTEGKNSRLTGPYTTDKFDVEGVEVDETGLDGEDPIQFAVSKKDGYLVLADDENADADGPIWEIAKVYTMADGQPGLKLFRVK